ncbi:MAG: dimethylamine corrinoid protein 3 [Firmicutes bacterium HGW-Firmicutes-14]|jgi:trimethylamine corrinoid protein|nr:MAG: dimethylamine corrinoid protein 3 [Firmicutes bacterium HGW-Firmicutes-14]
MSKEAIIKRAIQAVVDGDEEAAEQVARDTIAEGLNPVEVINEGLALGMTQVGDLFNNEEISLPFVIVAADAMIKAIAILEPYIPAESKGEKIGTVVIGTVEGDIHDIGKGIVATMLKVYGFEVFDLGRDVPISAFIDKAKEINADLIASSTLMTTTLVGQSALQEAVIQSGIKVKTMIGGAAVNQRWCDKIGADAYGENASEATRKAKELMLG